MRTSSTFPHGFFKRLRPHRRLRPQRLRASVRVLSKGRGIFVGEHPVSQREPVDIILNENENHHL